MKRQLKKNNDFSWEFQEHPQKTTSQQQSVNEWVEKTINMSPFSDVDKEFENPEYLSECDSLSSDGNAIRPSHVMASKSTTSIKPSFLEASTPSSCGSEGKKLRICRKSLCEKLQRSINKEQVEHIKEEEKISGHVDVVSSSLSQDVKKKCLKPIEVLKLLAKQDEKENILRDENKSQKLTKISKILDSSDTSQGFSTSSSNSNNVRHITKQTNFSSCCSDLNSVASVPTSESNPEKILNPPEQIESLKGVLMNNSRACQCDDCKKVFDGDLEKTPKLFADQIITQPDKNCVREKPQALLKRDQSKSEIVMVRKKDRHQTKIEKDMCPNLLIHCPGFFPSPFFELSAAPFCIPVHRALSAIKYKKPRSMQMYMWSALMRPMNACIINSRSSGKTMCYIPPLCSFLIDKENKYPFLPKENSPIAVILCDSIRKSEAIFDLLHSFLNYTSRKVDMALLVPPIEDDLLKIIKRADVIITTPRIFMRTVSQRTINLKRLCHLVIEDIDKVLEQAHTETNMIMNGIQSMLNHRGFINSVQIVMTSERWTPQLQNFIKTLEVTPVICIGSHLESMIYAKANVEMHFKQMEVKKKDIVAILKENSKGLKTVIVCNTEEEVSKLTEYFQVLGMSVTSFNQGMSKGDVEQREVLWLSTPLKNNSVLICTDYMLRTQLSITTAQVLIHYSLPTDYWSLFTGRFKCVIDSHDSPFNSNFNKENAVKIHIFVDESCSKQFPRLYYFLQQMGTILPPHFKSFCEKVEKDEESIKIKEGIPICNRLKLLGKCTKFRCKKRHLFSPKIDIVEDVPKSGIIKFKILNIADATQFGIKLLEHWDINRSKCQLNDFTNLVTKELRKRVSDNKLQVMNVRIGSMYVYFNAENVSYHRCVVLDILTRQNITDAAHEIYIKLIDDGIERNAYSSLLFELPEEFLKIPPQSMEARLANIVPLENDIQWNLRMWQKVKNLITDAIERYDNAYFVGRIVLQVGRIIWLEDVIMREDISSSNEVVTLMSLKKRLTKLYLVDVKEAPIKNLTDICIKSGLDLPNYEIVVKDEPVLEKRRQVKPQWAFLSTQSDVYNVVYFSFAESPNKFYVKLEEYYNLYTSLADEIETALEKPFYPEIEDVIEGNIYLAKDLEGDGFNRVMLKEIKGDEVVCFCVDFGDTIKIPKQNLLFLSDEHISKLPFQAIECDLYGVKPISDTWQTEATNIFYKYCYETNTDIYRNLFVNVVTSQTSDSGFQRYSVALLDYYQGKKTLINQILIDCGLALEDVNAKLDDLALPELVQTNEDEDDDFETNSNVQMNGSIGCRTDVKDIVESLIEKNEVEEIEDLEDTDEDIDKCIFENYGYDFSSIDFKTFMQELLMPKVISKPLQNNQKLPKNNFIPIKVAPSTNNYSPNVLWYQTKSHVILEFQLKNVAAYSVIVIRKKTLLFSTNLNGRDYSLHCQLFDTATLEEKSNNKQIVKVKLLKVKADEWPRLTSSIEKMRNIRYNWDKVKEEVQKRRFLELDMDDEDDDDNDDDDKGDHNLLFHNITSDEESDFDGDNCEVSY